MDERNDYNEWPAWVQGVFGAALFLLVIFADAITYWIAN